MSDVEDTYFEEEEFSEEEFSEDEEFNDSESDIDDKNEEKEEKIDEVEELIVELDIPEPQIEYKKVDKSKRVSLPILSKYEKTKLIGTRAIQISQNAQIYVDYKGLIDPIKIAKKELEEKKIPFIIRRYLPNGKYEDWNIDELRII